MRSASFFSRRVAVVIATALLLGGGASGCGHLGVKAHERELLADRIMKLDGDTHERSADEHVLSNGEGAIG